ncbi:MAG: phosphoribosylaminoimidazolesuccinocarboxamide synthase [Gemmatimonadales bacterium]|nr:phosphoribosylaminoimidazolesuccinocarboxamide synthase [Gemmatimonadales bacterium]
MTVVTRSTLDLPLLRRGKVREVYEVDADRLLLVASDRVSAFDVVMTEAIPRKGAVLTQLSAFWFGKLAHLGPTHFLTADVDEIIREVPRLAAERAQLAGRAMLVRKTEPIAFECVIRGFISGSAWKEYRATGTLAGARLPEGLRESDPFPAPIFSPATKAETGHDINVTPAAVARALGESMATELEQRSQAIYRAGRDLAAARGIIIADTKFEFGTDPHGTLRLIDEVLTPDSSRFWPKDQYQPGRSQPSFDKQPLRDYLQDLTNRSLWNMEAPGPTLPPEVIAATSARYLEAFRLLTGAPLPEFG